MNPSTKLNKGPEKVMTKISRFLFSLTALIGIGRDHPYPNRKNTIIPIGSKCLNGFGVALPKRIGVLSPSATAARACAHSCKPRAKITAGILVTNALRNRIHSKGSPKNTGAAPFSVRVDAFGHPVDFEDHPSRVDSWIIFGRESVPPGSLRATQVNPAAIYHRSENVFRRSAVNQV